MCVSGIWTPVCHHRGFERQVDDHVRGNRPFIIDELHEDFRYVLGSVLYETAIVQILYSNIHSRWAPRTLIDEHTEKE
jgi:hypothetical protein